MTDRRAAANLLLACASIVVALLLAKIGLRLFLPPPPTVQASRPRGDVSLTAAADSLYLLSVTTGITENLLAIRGRMAAAALRAGRAQESIILVGVSKTVPPERIREAVAAGLGDLGENRVQEAREKTTHLQAPVRWHLVGHLQGNKANQAARLFDVVHSIDSIDILERLDRATEREGRRMMGLVQIDLAGEPTKFGVPTDALDRLLEAASGCRSVQVRGLMVLPPYDPDPERSRPYFRRLRDLLQEARRRHSRLDLEHLSMGMTEDFEIAIEEGATMVRVGRALFGERTQA